MVNAKSQRMGSGELVALIAMLFSTVAFSVDAILPAMPQIDADLQGNSNVYLLITMFMGGLALGTLFAGPLSDAFGRKRVMYLGSALYIGSGLVAWLSNSFEIVVAARAIQGIGAAGPRVVSLAIVRDLYHGDQMARIVSFAMVIFTIVPTLAPAMGALLANQFGWRSILLSFVVFALVSTIWLATRLEESLPVSARRPFRLPSLIAATREITNHPVVRLAILAQSVALALIFSLIVQVQPIYDRVFGMADSFAYWFGGIALFSAASTSLANARLVIIFGARRMITLGMSGQVICAAVTLVGLVLFPKLAFISFVLWQFMVIWLSGLCVGNLNAIALEPMGHIAGLTASLTGGISTLLAAIASGFVGMLFNGTPVPLVLSALILGLTGVGLMWRLNHHAQVQLV